MIIASCDFLLNYRQIAFLATESWEIEERSLTHSGSEVEQFYGGLGRPALVGMEAVGNAQWFVGLLERLGHEVWIVDAAQTRASYVRQQKTDRRGTGHILNLLIEGRFPRIWAPTTEMRDHYMHMIRHQVPFFNPALLLLRQLSEHLPQVPPQLFVQCLPTVLRSE